MLLATGSSVRASLVYWTFAELHAEASSDYAGSDYEYLTSPYQEVPDVDLSVYAEVLSARGGSGAIASLSNGWLKSYSSAIVPGVFLDPNSGQPAGSHAAASSKTTFHDTLLFTIAPGHYDHDIVFSISGRVTGFLAASPEAQGQAGSESTFWASMLSVGAGPSANFSGTWKQNGAVLEDFVLTTTLFRAGDYLEPFNQREVLLSAWLETYAYAVSRDPDLPSPAVGVAEFSNSARFLRVDVPPEVTSWTSASGVFMSNQAVPEPSTVVLLLIGTVPGGLWIARRSWAGAKPGRVATAHRLW
jgi:hypothetical protein